MVLSGLCFSAPSPPFYDRKEGNCTCLLYTSPSTGAPPVSTASSPWLSGAAASPPIRWMSDRARPRQEAGSSSRKSYQGSSRMLSACISQMCIRDRVTSDGAEQLIILGHGALRLPAASFRREVEEAEGEISAILARHNRGERSRPVKEALERAAAKERSGPGSGRKR